MEKESVESEEQLVDAVANITARLLGLPPPAVKTLAAREPKPAPSGLAATTKEKPFTNILGMPFIPVPGSKTLMCIWETRVRDYEAFVSTTGCQWQKPSFKQDPSHPAVNVSWNDAMAFCEWLTEKEQNEGTLKVNQGYRLPTDAEWSLAVGLKDEQESTPAEKSEKIPDVYPWGRQWPPPTGAQNLNSQLGVDDFPYTSPVGSFKPGKNGFYDLSGNVWEWCNDFLNGRNGERVYRGGGWEVKTTECLLSSRRAASWPNYRSIYLGFRCVLVDSSQ